jgi:hypothetical protein
MASFEEALPGLQAQGYSNIMDALAAYNQGQQQAYVASAAPVSNQQITSYLQANPGMADTQIASAMQTYGVTPQQMAEATGVSLPEVQSRYDVANTQNQGIQSLVNQAYANIGRTGIGTGASNVDQKGYNYWTGQLQSGAMTPEQFQRAFSYSAAPELVTSAYQNVLGRTADTPGSEYYTEQLKTGAMTANDLRNALAYGAQGLEDRLAAQKFLGKDIFAPAEYLKGTSGFSYQDVVDYINANVQDPVKIAQAAARYGIDPTEILAAKKAVGGQDIPTIKEIEDFLAKGSSGLGTRITDIVGSTIGDAERLTAIQNALPANQKTSFTADTFKNKSIEEIESLIRNSKENRLDKADEVASFLSNIYGTPAADARNIRTSLFQDKDTDDKAEKLYKAFINNTVTKDVIDSYYIDAAKNNPTSPYFTKNPNELIKYTPIKEIVESPKDSGQYGYYKDAPILSASEADRLLGNKTFVGNDNSFGYGSGTERDDKLGWDLRSKYAGSIANGAGIVGVKATEDQINEFDRIQKEINKLGGAKNGYVSVEQTDYESGQKYRANIPVSELFATKVTNEGSNGGENYKLYQDTMEALKNGAQQLGINPANFNTPSSLFKAVDDRLQNTYLVTGRANNWDEDVANKAGITGVGQSRGGVNHAQVLYEKVGDKLVPTKTIKTFNFDDPNTTRGFFGDLAQGIASVPFVAELALTNPATAAFYPVIKGAQVLALGGDFEDALKAGGLAFLTTNFIPKTLGPMIQTEIATSNLVSSLAQSSPELANFITKAGSNAAISAGLATLTGQDPFDAATATLVSSGVFQTTKAGLDFTSAIPDQYKPVVAQIITSTILGKDPEKTVTGVATDMIGKELKDFVKTREVMTDERRPTIQA